MGQAKWSRVYHSARPNFEKSGRCPKFEKSGRHLHPLHRGLVGAGQAGTLVGADTDAAPRGLAEAPTALMRTRFIVLGQPSVKIALQFVDQTLHLLAERHHDRKGRWCVSVMAYSAFLR